jgi:hypothetical protein
LMMIQRCSPRESNGWTGGHGRRGEPSWSSNEKNTSTSDSTWFRENCRAPLLPAFNSVSPAHLARNVCLTTSVQNCPCPTEMYLSGKLKMNIGLMRIGQRLSALALRFWRNSPTSSQNLTDKPYSIFQSRSEKRLC